MKFFVFIFSLILSGPAFSNQATLGLCLSQDGNGACKMLVYRDKVAEEQVNCPCHAFKVVVAEGWVAVGGTAVRQAKMYLSKAESQTEQLYAMYRCMGSPLITNDAFVIQVSNLKNKKIRFEGLAQKCINPTSPECNNMIARFSKTVSLKKLMKLEPTNSHDAMNFVSSQGLQIKGCGDR